MYTPSQTMSCVAPLKPMTARRAMAMVKKLGKPRENATSPKVTPETICVSTTQNFLVLNNSRNGLHSGLSV